MSVRPLYETVIEKQKGDVFAMWPYFAFPGSEFDRKRKEYYGSERGDHVELKSAMKGFDTRIILNAGNEPAGIPRWIYTELWEKGYKWDFDLIIAASNMYNSHLPELSGKKVAFKDGIDRSKPIKFIKSKKGIIGVQTKEMYADYEKRELGVIIPKEVLPEDYKIPAITHEYCSNIGMYGFVASNEIGLLNKYRGGFSNPPTDELLEKGGKDLVDKYSEKVFKKLLETTFELAKIAKKEGKGDQFVFAAADESSQFGLVGANTIPFVDGIEKAMKDKFNYVYEAKWLSAGEALNKWGMEKKDIRQLIGTFKKLKTQKPECKMEIELNEL